MPLSEYSPRTLKTRKSPSKMEKKPIFGRLALVVAITLVALFQWYPNTGGQDMVEVFEGELKPNHNIGDIIADLKERQKKLKRDETLSLDDWNEALAGKDLRDLVSDRLKGEVFPPVLLDEKLEERLLKDAQMEMAAARIGALYETELSKEDQKLKKAHSSLLRKIGLNPNNWNAPGPQHKEIINRELLKRVEQIASGKVQLGLDLRGGVQFVVQIQAKPDPERPGQLIDITDAERDQAIETFRSRIDSYGVTEPLIQAQGPDIIVIQVPALSQAQRDQVRRSITSVTSVAFHLTVRSSDADSYWEDYLSGKNENTVTQEDADEFNANYSKALGALLLIETNLDELGNEYTRGVFVEREASVPGRHINRASVSASELTGVPEIHFNLDGTGGTLMARATGRHKRDQPDPRRLGIVRTDTRIIGTGEKARAEQFKTLVSAPSINGRIATRGMIEGIDSYEEATTISSALNNPLENPVRIIESRTVDPSLGRRSIEQGYKAAIWGLIVVAVFMLIYYLLSGVMANIALSLNIVILLGVLCWFDATLTLPGIAGVVLTIGMAVDANVLIYERIREELNLGKSLKGAITSGYDKAFGTIFDANITTMIASLILIYMGKGPVKGFGYTLTIGIITSMFTALVATRVVMDFLLNAGIIGSDNSKRAMHLRPTAGLPKFDFLKYATPAFIGSWILIIIGFGFGASKGSSQMLGVDFEGGNSYLIDFNQTIADELEAQIDNEEFREKLSTEAGIDEQQIQASLQTDTREQDDGTTMDVKFLRLSFPVDADTDTVKKILPQLQAGAEFKVAQEDKVGPTVSGEITKTAFVAVGLALFGILIYVAFRYEFSFAIAAVIAILHDVLMTGGWFFLTGRELNAPIVAAALTIIGFSINDTIVIFDRIRENLKMGTRGSFADVMNKALNQTLSRTIITSGTTLVSTGALYFFGGPVINDFAFTFLVGVITGTYSSIYIACAIVLWWHKGKRPELSVGIAETNDPVEATT
ncbi:MAG: hypothetical protein CMO78_05450 [Verrucomicrobiales bacterium]|nr:hypothetical protein [Verrucomicrobiales bacterium]